MPNMKQVSKSSRQTDARLRENFHNLRKIMAFVGETVKITPSNLILGILTHFFCVFGLSGTFSCTIFFLRYENRF